MAKHIYADLAYLNEVSNGDKAFIREMIAVFLKKAPGMLDSIAGAFQDEDHEQLYFAAHSLHTSCLMLGIQKMLPLLAALEAAAKKQEAFGQLSPQISELLALGQSVIDSLKGFPPE